MTTDVTVHTQVNVANVVFPLYCISKVCWMGYKDTEKLRLIQKSRNGW